MSDSIMPGMKTGLIADAVGGQLFGDPDIAVTSVTSDSRQAADGALFIAIKGARVDGHDFIDSVRESGAAAVICERRVDSPITQIVVGSSVAALGALAAYYRRQLTVKTVLVTGSVGKTSTKEMIASVLSQHFNTLKTEGNLNNEIGLPLTVLKLKPGHEAAVLEAGIDEPGEMDVIAAAAGPDICVITNIGICHMENLGSRQGIFDEKTKCFNYMREGGRAILPATDDMLRTVKSAGGSAPMFFSAEEGVGDVYVSSVNDMGYEGSSAVLNTPAGSVPIRLHIPGIHQLANAAAAACAGLTLGMSLSEIAAGIEAARTIGGRTNLIVKNGVTIVDDCYNASPATVMAALDLLKKAKGRKIAVLGDMGELGPDEAVLHKQVGEYAAKAAPDALFLTGELSKNTLFGARCASHGLYSQHISDRAQLISTLKRTIRPGDTVLIKASHFMHFEEIVKALT